MTKLLEYEGTIDLVWDFGSHDIIGFEMPKTENNRWNYQVLHFKRGTFTERFPLKTKVKITIETVEG